MDVFFGPGLEYVGHCSGTCVNSWMVSMVFIVVHFEMFFSSCARFLRIAKTLTFLIIGFCT